MKPKKIIIYTLLLLLLSGTIWIVNLIYFKPFSINLFYNKVFVAYMLSEPEAVTQLGIPILGDFYKSDLSDISDKKMQADVAKTKENLAILQSYDKASQSQAQLLNTEILEWFLQNQIDGEKFMYHGYPVNQLQGVQSDLPDLLAIFHPMKSKSDAEAYITRLSKFPLKFDQLLEGLKLREDKGIIPPKFVIQKVIKQVAGFKDSLVEKNVLYTAFASKLDSIKLDEKEKEAFKTRAKDEITKSVFSSYKRLQDYLTLLEAKATTDDGVWKLPNGAEYYTYMLKNETTTNITPQEVHDLGLKEVARISKEIRTILAKKGYTDTTKTLGNYIQLLSSDPKYLYPDSDEGRKQCIADFKAILEKTTANTAPLFNIVPKAKLEVERVPEFKEATAPGAYYFPPALDGTRGGIFYANLRSIKEQIKYQMPTLAIHEGIPGHHFQIAIQSELEGLPIFRNILGFTSYAEGWALYAERLTYENGFYKDDEDGNLGRLIAEMFRAVRLVVDSGIHYKKWTREEAIKYMNDNTGMPVTDVVAEIERYIVWPGQATAYKIGQLKILALRDKAKGALGEKFKIQDFHDVVLKNGSVPLFILEKLVDAYIAEKSKNS